MRFRNTLLVVVIFIALGGYTYFFEMKRENGAGDVTPEPTATFVWELDPTDVVQLDVIGPDGRTRLVRGEGTSWSLVDPETGTEEPADDVRVNRVVNLLARLQARRVFTGTIELSEYGLDDPAWRAEVRLRGGEQETLWWGDQTPQRSAYYVKKGEEGKVYVVDAFTIEDMERLVREPAYAPTPTPTATVTPAGGEATPTPAAGQE